MTPQQQQQQQQQNQFAWMQYQQMLQAQQFYGQQHAAAAAAAAAHQASQSASSDIVPGPDSRRRTSSTPQRPQPITYNDTLRREQQQHASPVTAPFPGVSYNAGVAQLQQMRSFAGQPMGANQFGQVTSPGHSASSSVSSPGGFHPYRRTQRSASSDVGGPNSQNFPSGITASPSSIVSGPMTPRIRTGSAASQSSLRETSPMLVAERKRGMSAVSPSASAPGLANTAAPKNLSGSGTPQGGLAHLRGAPPRNNSQSSVTSDGSSRTATANSSSAQPAHQRTDSAASLHSINTSQRIQPPSINSASSSKKPSPLSRQAREDDEEAVYGGSDDDRVGGGRSTPMPGYAPKAAKKTGLSSKLKKALSFSNLNEIQQQQSSYAGNSSLAARRQNPVFGRDGGLPNSSGDTNASTGSTRSTSPPRTPDNGSALPGSSAASITSRRGTRPPLSNNNEGKRSIFNRKFNSSTDNISISSTVSSASVMLRKVGNLGKLARRHSLMGLTNMFNKDKDREGRDGLQGDSFGSVPSASDDSAINTKSKKATKSNKGIPASASVSHATVELERAHISDAGMTPAASYVRQHQLQMQAQAEAEARAARERQESETKAREASENRQKMIEKEKERLKSKRGWRKRFGSGSSSNGGSISSIASDIPNGLETGATDSEQFSDAVSAQPREAEPIVSAVAPRLSIVYPDEEGFDASFDSALLEPPQMPAAGGLTGEDSSDEFETDSLRHWGEGIERSRASAAQFKNPKGILKKTASTPDLSLSGGFEKPFAGRIRANSYDAPQAASASSTLHSSSTMTHISSSAAGVERLDGLAKTDSPVSSRPGSRSGDYPSRSASPGLVQHAGGVLGHHSNSSMPTLSLMMDPGADFLTQRSVTAPMQTKKKLSFADDLIFHSTWPATVYDRRGEQATCNRLTPLLAQRIKEELNTYKMEEMAVAPSSRIYTHFFV